MDITDQLLAKQVTGGKSPSVQYIIFEQDMIMHRFQSGLADVKQNRSVNWNTTYNAFSVTKTFTALAILQLEENGRCNIDDKAADHISNFPYSRDITIRQLLAHTSGIPNPNPLSWIHLETEHTGFNRDTYFDDLFMKHSTSKSKPNQKFRYSNLGYMLLGQIIEAVSGMRYEEYITEYILKPIDIGPESLGFEIHDKALHAKGYQKRISLINCIIGFFLDKKKFMDKAEGKWKPFKFYYLNGPSYGGLIGTPDGFRKYIQALLKKDGRLISDLYKRQLFTEHFNRF